MSATIFVPESMISSPVYAVFRAELKELLRKHKAEVKILRLRGVSSGVYLKSQMLIQEIKLLLSRYGCVMTVNGVADYETPLFGAHEPLLGPELPA